MKKGRLDHGRVDLEAVEFLARDVTELCPGLDRGGGGKSGDERVERLAIVLKDIAGVGQVVANSF